VRWTEVVEAYRFGAVTFSPLVRRTSALVSNSVCAAMSRFRRRSLRRMGGDVRLMLLAMTRGRVSRVWTLEGIIVVW